MDQKSVAVNKQNKQKLLAIRKKMLFYTLIYTFYLTRTNQLGLILQKMSETKKIKLFYI